MASRASGTGGPCTRHAHARRKAVAPAFVALFMVLVPWHMARAAPVQTAEPTSGEFVLEADHLIYDFDADTITASGAVTIVWNSYRLTARQLVYDRMSHILGASGDVRLIEPDGYIVQAQTLRLSDDFADGFVTSLVVETPERTYLSARKVARSGTRDVYEDAQYSPYRPLPRPPQTDAQGERETDAQGRAPPHIPPLWRIRAVRVIHERTERVIVYENAALEFFGIPAAFMPRLVLPDPVIRRKTGFLVPSFIESHRLGIGVSIPYFLAPAPHYDAQLVATPLSRQGVLLEGQWRHRTAHVTWSVHGAAISQARPELFAGSASGKPLRGAVGTSGHADLPGGWTGEWNLAWRSDRLFFEDYPLAGDAFDGREVSHVSLARSDLPATLEINAYAFQIARQDRASANRGGPQGRDLQKKQPFILPVIDYYRALETPVAGGTVSLRGNFTHIYRQFDDIYIFDGTAHDRSISGNLIRASLAGEWQRRMILPGGLALTPFARLKGDLRHRIEDTQPHDRARAFQLMPALGIDAAFPFLIPSDTGYQILEPIAQLVIRPDEADLRLADNEDAQSLILESASLFSRDKFSGFDRTEGGIRLNLGIDYRLERQAFHIAALFGFSQHLAGKNSFASALRRGAGTDSGLATARSDYVAHLRAGHDGLFELAIQQRLSSKNLSPTRTEIQLSGQLGALSAHLSYADIAPRFGPENRGRRRELNGGASFSMSDHWRAFGTIRYDARNAKVVQNAIGVSYLDSGFSASLTYLQDHARHGGTKVDKIIALKLGFRTLGESGLSFDIGRQTP